MSHVVINQWLQPVSTVLGQSLVLDEHGLLGLELDNGLQCAIEFDSDNQMLTLHADLLQLQPAQVQQVCEAAMERNLYGIGSFGLTLGFDKARSALVASASYPLATLNEESFVIHLERFVSALDALHRDFSRTQAPAVRTGVAV